MALYLIRLLLQEHSALGLISCPDLSEVDIVVPTNEQTDRMKKRTISNAYQIPPAVNKEN